MIRMENLTKKFGDFTAVNSINFEINTSEIIGFLGPNGAGKSTTMKMLTCYLTPTDGNCFVDDYNIYENTIEIRKKIGYLPETNPLYYDMNVFEYLKFVAEIRKIKPNSIKNSMDRVISECGLNSVVYKTIGNLSKGFKQRVGLAQAIIHEPEILVLDEPTSGLDPVQIIEIRKLIKKLGKEKTVILSTHIMQEVEATCNRVIIIDKGNIVADNSMENLINSSENKQIFLVKLVNFNEDIDLIKNKLNNIIDINLISETEKEKYFKFTCSSKTENMAEKIFRFAVENNYVLTELHKENLTLEKLFLDLTINKGGN